MRLMRFEDLYEKWGKKSLTQAEAGDLLGVSERTFRRYCRSYESTGYVGLYDKRLDRKAHNGAPIDEILKLQTLYTEQYAGYTISHFYDKYCDDNQGTRSYSWVKRQLQDAGLAVKAKKRGAHRRKRERASMVGMMLHQDGSTHEWVSGQVWDSIVTMDDADSTVYSGFFVEEEGTHSSFRGVQEVIEAHGLFCT